MKKIIALLLIAMFSIAVLGCSRQAAKSPAPEQTAKKNLAGTTLKAYAAYGPLDKIFAEFQKETGIKVEFLDMSSGEVLSKLRAEKGKPTGDIWFGGGVDSFIAAQSDGLLEPYISPEAAKVPAQYKEKDGYWTGVSLAIVTFLVNKDRCKELGIPVPESWADLLNPKLKGEVVMSDPAVSGTAYFTLYGLIKDTAQGWPYMGKLNVNIPAYAKRGGEPPQKAAIGEATVGISPDTSEELKAQGYPAVTVFPKDGTPWWPSPVAILKGSQNPDGAKAFVDWCLSEKGQNILKQYTPRVPAREGIAYPAVVEGIKSAKMMNIDFIQAGNERDAILAQFQKIRGK